MNCGKKTTSNQYKYNAVEWSRARLPFIRFLLTLRGNISFGMAGQSVSESRAVVTCKRQLFLLLLFCVFLSLMECMHASPKNGLRIDLVHIDSLLSQNITSTERVKRAVQRSRERFEKLQTVSAVNTRQMKDVESPVSTNNGDYLMEMAIGTPPFPSLQLWTPSVT